MLMSQMQMMLDKARLTFADLGLVAVCTGPGSFTGVRSSVAAARTFALACPNLSVCGINAFEAYAESLPLERRAPRNAVLIETKRDDFYFQCFDADLKRIGEPCVAAYNEIIRALSGEKVSLVGDGVERFLSRPSGLSLHEVELSSAVDVAALARCALKRYRTKTLDFPKPMYLKAPDVCIK
jgi:tRNA threonylcarbamoyladenosine biosynthesis protein TsaB